MKLKSIAEEEADCRAAWAAMPEAQHGLHIHHDTAVEWLWKRPISDRIDFILMNKPAHEQALRFRLMRPISEEVYAGLKSADDVAWNKLKDRGVQYEKEAARLHRPFCVKDCPFDGFTIFPKEKK